MASDSQTATATTSEKPLENKVNEEAKLMEKEIVVLQESADAVKDKPVSDSNLTVKEEKTNQTPAGEAEKEPPTDVEEVAAVVKVDESTEKGADENGEKKVELEEPTPVKQSVEEVNVEVADAEKAEGKGKDENGEGKVAEEMELKEPTLVKEGVEEVKLETVDVEKAEEKKPTVESVAEEDNKDKEETEVIVVSESTDEAGGKQLEDKIKDVEVLEVEPEQEASEKVETQPEKANELAPDVEVVKTKETPETAEQDKVELEDSIVETKDSGSNSKGEQTSESGSALCPEERVPINKDSDTAPQTETEADASSPADVIEKAITEEKHVVDERSKDEKNTESVSALCPEKAEPTNQDPDTNLEKKTEGDVSSPADVTEKAITEEKHVMEEPSKDEQENVTEAKDVATKASTEDENIKSEETLKETEGTKQEASITEKVAEVVETSPVVKESDETKQEAEVRTKEVAVEKKHSNSIMSKVKKSLVKAKKAIIGKSPSSKTIVTEEAKEDIKAK